MDALTVAIAVALAEGLVQVGGKLAAASVDAALKPAKEMLEARLLGGFRQAEKDQKLLKVVQQALQEAGAPADESDKLKLYLQRTGLARLGAEGSHALRRQVARAVLAFTDPQAGPPEELVVALGWPRSQKAELARLLAALRAGLAGLEGWGDLVRYADAAANLQLLRQILGQLAGWEDALVHTEAGRALRVAITDLRMDEAQAVEIERQYRQGLQNEYRMHVVTGLTQVQKAVRLPLQDIYLELGLIPLSSERDQQADLEQALAAPEAERLRREMERVERRVSNALADAQQMVIVGKPGSGKTTSLKFIALMLACGAPGASRLGLDAPFLPLYVRLVDYAEKLRDDSSLALETFLKDYIEKAYPGAPRQDEYLRLALERGGCMILLDGLDEVGDVGDTLIHGRTLRSEVLRQVRRFADRRCGADNCNRLVVTSRLEGYRRGDLPGFTEMEISPLRLPDEVEDFLLRWFTAYIQQSDAQLPLPAAEARARRDHVEHLMPAILRWESIRRLALNPLLLTILAIIHEMGKRLPHRRVELYEVVAKTFVENWRMAQTDRASRIYKDLRPSDIFYMLSALAYWLHENKPGGTMPRSEWQQQIEALLAEEGRADGVGELIESFLRHAREEVGLLAERSPGQIGFFHLTLEEYLAAVEIARREVGEQLAILEAHWENPRWEEVLLLTADELDWRGRREALRAYLNALLTLEVRDPQQAARPVLLAGRALADIGQVNPNNPVHRNVLRALHECMQDLDPASGRPSQPGRLPALVRAEAGDVLDELGWLPADLYAFVRIDAAGLAQHGLRAGENIELPFYLGKYPVTNAQYARFVQAEDFADPQWWRGFPKFDERGRPMPGDWGEAGWEWLQRALQGEHAADGSVSPRFWNDPRFGIARRGVPVLGVTWYEAGAYCRWLARHWGELEEGPANPGLRPAQARLPLEAEWALAAGGETPRERFPWDAPGAVTQEKEMEAILRRANVRESKIGRTTPVGMYPLGASWPFGLWDLGGNAWEWQANFYRENSNSPALRGGAWNDDWDYARPSARVADRPGYLWLDVGFRVWARPSHVLVP